MFRVSKVFAAIFLYNILGVTYYVQADSQYEALESMKTDYEKSIKDSTNPNSVESLSHDILKKAFELTNPNPGGLSVMELMQKLQTVKGATRYYILRIFELMDSYADGHITKAEVMYALRNPVSSPYHLATLLFKIKDLDENGIITPWEIMREKLDLESSNAPLSKLWQKSVEEIQIFDVDSNHVIDMEEFMLGLVMDTNIAIAEPRLKEKMKNQNGFKAASDTGRANVVPQRAHKPNPSHI